MRYAVKIVIVPRFLDIGMNAQLMDLDSWVFFSLFVLPILINAFKLNFRSLLDTTKHNA